MVGEVAAQVLAGHVGLHRENETGLGQKRPVLGQGSHADAVLALLQGNGDGGLLDHRGEGLAQRHHEGGEGALQILVPVDRERRRSPRRHREGGQLAGDPEGDGEEGLGMDALGGGQMRQQRLAAVDRLQQQEIGDLGDALGVRLGDAMGQGLATVVDQALQLVEEARQHRRGAAIEAGRNVMGVENHALVGPHLDHAGQPEAGVAGPLVGFEGKAKAQLADP